jgi:hypothetical protein
MKKLLLALGLIVAQNNFAEIPTHSANIETTRKDVERHPFFARFLAKMPKVAPEYKRAQYYFSPLAQILLGAHRDKCSHEQAASRETLRTYLQSKPNPDLTTWTVHLINGMRFIGFAPVLSLAIDRPDLLKMLLATQTEPLPKELLTFLADLTENEESKKLLLGNQYKKPGLFIRTNTWLKGFVNRHQTLIQMTAIMGCLGAIRGYRNGHFWREVGENTLGALVLGGIATYAEKRRTKRQTS